jgi:hypothetical protein
MTAPLMNVRRFRKFIPDLWNTARFRSLSDGGPSARMLLIYLLTGPKSTACPGLLNIGPAALAEEMEWPPEGLCRVLEELEQQDRVIVDRKNRLLWVPEALGHNRPDNPNATTSWALALLDMPECPLRATALEAVREYLSQRELEPDKHRKDHGNLFLSTFDGKLAEASGTFGTVLSESPGTLPLTLSPSGAGAGAGTTTTSVADAPGSGLSSSKPIRKQQTKHSPQDLAKAQPVVACWQTSYKRRFKSGAPKPTPWDIDAAVEMVDLHGLDLVLTIVEGAMSCGTERMRVQNRWHLSHIKDEWSKLISMRRKGELV